jgi:hypothetical protein
VRILRVLEPSKVCIYCGGGVRRQKKGEHIIPNALGGELTLDRDRRVCGNCNNIFSVIDNELASKSPLQDFAWQVLSKNSPVVWDYDPVDNLVLKARILPSYQSPALWPQLVFYDRGWQFRADIAELERIGADKCLAAFYHHAKNARKTLHLSKRKRRWIWELIKTPPKIGRYPARLFTPHALGEFNHKMSFICRYTKAEEQDYFLSRFDNWRKPQNSVKVEKRLGVNNPPFVRSWVPRKVIKALAKIGINLLAYYCKRTEVNLDTFTDTVEFVLHDREPAHGTINGGFVIFEDAAFLHCPEDCHAVELSGTGALWQVSYAFFGGVINATVSFPGPNFESWGRLVVTAPLNSRDWTADEYKVAGIRTMKTTLDIRAMAPTLPVENVQIFIRYEKK